MSTRFVFSSEAQYAKNEDWRRELQKHYYSMSARKNTTANYQALTKLVQTEMSIHHHHYASDQATFQPTPEKYLTSSFSILSRARKDTRK